MTVAFSPWMSAAIQRPRRGGSPPDPKKAVAYVRASTSKQAASPAAQLAAIKTWAVKEDIEVIAVFEDKATSGDADLEDRPGVLAAIESLRLHRAGLLVVAKRDRLARDRVVVSILDRLVQKAGCKVTSADGMSEGEGPESTLLKGVMDLFSEFEVGVIRARTRGALAHRKAAGLRVGGVPFGFAVGPDGKHLVMDAAEQRTLALILRLRRTRSLRGVIAELIRRKVPNRSGNIAWTVGQIARMIAKRRDPEM